MPAVPAPDTPVVRTVSRTERIRWNDLHKRLKEAKLAKVYAQQDFDQFVQSMGLSPDKTYHVSSDGEVRELFASYLSQ